MRLIGNCNDIINWDSVIQEIAPKPGTVLHYNDSTFDRTLPGFDKLALEWERAGYKLNDPAIEWINYFPGHDFDISIQNQFESIVKFKPFSAWISRIKPLRMAPWHFDAHSKITTIKDKNIKRYVCYIEQPSSAHVSIVGDTVIYKPPQGSIYEWNDYNEYHCGMNGGYTDKYLFNYWGYDDI